VLISREYKNVSPNAPVLICKVIVEDLKRIVPRVENNGANLSVHIPPQMAVIPAVPNLNNLFWIVFEVTEFKVLLPAE
jgi:hypothetical protein